MDSLGEQLAKTEKNSKLQRGILYKHKQMGTHLRNTVTRMVRADERLDEGPSAGALHLIF